MKIQLFKFKKKLNSTKRPDTAGTEYDISLKDDCSILSPNVTLQYAGNPTDFNYAYIPEFNRYYFINNWTANRGLWSAAMSVDFLASWRNEIGDSEQYIARSQAEFDGDVADTLYPAISGYVAYDFGIDNPYITNYDDGYFVVGVSTTNPTDSFAIGMVNYYILDIKAFNNFAKGLAGSDLFDKIKNGILKPGSYIVSCKWFPIDIRENGFPVITIDMGTASYECEGALGMLYKNFEFTLQHRGTFPHPQAAERGNYLNLSPYTNVSLLIPPFGSISISTASIYDFGVDSGDLRCRFYVDLVSGVSTMNITVQPDGGFESTIGTYQAQLGIDIPLIEGNIAIGNVISNAVSGANNVSTGIIAGDNIKMLTKMKQNSEVLLKTKSLQATRTFSYAGAAMAIGNAALSMIPKAQTINASSGSMSFYNIRPTLTYQFARIVDESPDFGKPLMKIRRIADLPGYMEVLDPHLDFPATDSELSDISAQIAGGFYFE